MMQFHGNELMCTYKEDKLRTCSPRVKFGVVVPDKARKFSTREKFGFTGLGIDRMFFC